MKKFLMAGMAVGLLTVSAPISAHASDATYTGGCGFTALNDTTPGGQLGGQDVWNGAVYLMAVATTGGVPNGSPITASCELKVNGVSQGTVLGPVSGTGAVATGGTIQFTGGTDIVSMCIHVTTDAGTEVTCNDETTTQILPQPVIDIINTALCTIENPKCCRPKLMPYCGIVVDTVIGIANTVIDLLNQSVFSQLDPTICAGLLALAPAVNSLGHPEIIHIDADGDLHASGVVLAILGADTSDPAYDLVWDCPPYRT